MTDPTSPIVAAAMSLVAFVAVGVSQTPGCTALIKPGRTSDQQLLEWGMR
jgi:hypothetical protein